MTTFDWLLVMGAAVALFVAIGIGVEWWIKRKELPTLTDEVVPRRSHVPPRPLPPRHRPLPSINELSTEDKPIVRRKKRNPKKTYIPDE